jgi:tetratricopeptide (TPR) repeat protein
MRLWNHELNKTKMIARKEMESHMRRRSLATILLTLLTLPAYAAEKKCELKRVAELPVTMSGTQPIIAGTINGKPMRFLVDSGAFFSVLARDTAQKLQLRESPLPYGLTITGVGGAENMGLTKAREFSLTGLLNGYIYKDVDFLVSGNPSLADVDGLIGQNFLRSFDIEYDLANGFIRMFLAENCKDRPLAYWGGAVAAMEIKSTSPASPHWISNAKINDKKIRVLFDSGAGRSLLDRAAAANVGITPQQQGVTASGVTGGIGSQSVELVFARFDSLDLGGEQIKNARLFVGDLSRYDGPDLLLGADFFLSHRMYFSSKQNKLYFTYNGGAVFNLSANGSERSALASNASESDEVADSKTLMSSADLRRRGTASAGRRDLKSAIADYDRAIRLDPNDAENYYERGKVYVDSGQLQLAANDFDQALKLRPEYVAALLARGATRLGLKDLPGARADFDAAQRLDPTDSATALAIAAIFGGFDLHAESIERLNVWIAAFPKDKQLPRALNDRCWSRAIVGTELDLALADCNLALKKGPRNSQVLDSRAFVYLRRGEYDKSIADYQAVLKLQPQQGSSMYGLGLAEVKKGLKVQGEQHLQAAVALSAKVADFYNNLALVP